MTQLLQTSPLLPQNRFLSDQTPDLTPETVLPEPHIITDNLDELLAILPTDLCAAISPEERPNLIEIVLDLGRKPEARFVGRTQYLRDGVVSREELDSIEASLGAFGDDNRAGLPATLHRISALRNRRGAVVGLTLRVGRAVTGIVDILRDLIESGQSILLMGRPGLGKTTMLREIARVLADEGQKRVVIVDTSNEIAGDGDVPHPAIGRARRMQVPRVALQHDVMIEAVENHMPEVIVIDEIGRTEETIAARTIAERGVQLIATVHGNTLDNLLANPSMTDLIGGIQTVTLGDEEARRRRTQKTVSERKNPPTFDVVVEMIERDKIAVRRPVADVVDAILRGHNPAPEIRWRDDSGEINIMAPAPIPEPPAPSGGHDFSGRTDRRESRNGSRNRNGNGGAQNGSRHTPNNVADGVFYASKANAASASPSRWSEEKLDEPLPTIVERLPGERPNIERPAREEGEEALPSWQSQPVDMTKIRRVYPFGISRSRLARAAKHLGLSITPARTWNEADAVFMLSGEEGLPASSSMLREARELKLPIIGIGGNTYAQIVARLNVLYDSPGVAGQLSPRDIATQEAKDAANRVMLNNAPVELRPQMKSLRRLQHQVAERYHLKSFSIGREPNRRVKVVPLGGR
ncbi:MAG TPA: R3H domain-containing nucleic acid-binding protein [Abditibacterium sp.]|jgi:stage III sporulation protein SpoIIIAA